MRSSFGSRTRTRRRGSSTRCRRRWSTGSGPSRSAPRRWAGSGSAGGPSATDRGSWKVPERTLTPSLHLEVGDRVNHDKYGLGTVVASRRGRGAGDGDDRLRQRGDRAADADRRGAADEAVGRAPGSRSGTGRNAPYGRCMTDTAARSRPVRPGGPGHRRARSRPRRAPRGRSGGPGRGPGRRAGVDRHRRGRRARRRSSTPASPRIRPGRRPRGIPTWPGSNRRPRP